MTETQDGKDLYKLFGIPSPDPFSTSLQIFVGEAHNEMRLILNHHLQKLGFTNVRSSRDGATCLMELKEKPAHLMIGGDDLPGVSGYDLINDLSEDIRFARPAFILLTHSMNKNEFMFAMERGVDDILVRPIVPNDIMPKMKNAYNSFINPKNPERLYEYAKTLLRKSELDKSYTVYKKLAETSQKAARPYIGMARILMAQAKTEEALQNANKAIESNENYVHAYVLRAEILMALGKSEQAVIDLQKAISISPLNSQRYELCVNILLKNKMIEDCIVLLEKAISLELRESFIVERLGYCYFTKKEYQSALKYLKEAVRLEPENISYLNSLAICFRDSKDYESAIQKYNQILKISNDNHLVLFNKALTLILMNKNEEAIKTLRRVLKIDPNFKKARDKLTDLGVKVE